MKRLFNWFRKKRAIKRSDGPSDKGVSITATSLMDFDPDRPIHTLQQDRLGFSAIAEKLAISVLSSGVREGLVIGIEGQWGSGKSSILNLVCAYLRRSPDKVTVIRFDPWIVGDRDSLVSALIAELSSAVAQVVNNTKDGSIHAHSVAKKLRSYGSRIGKGISPMGRLAAHIGRGFLPIAKLAALFGLSYAETVAKYLEAGTDALDVKESKKPLAALKDELVIELRKLDHRFIIIIDDIDRLEPAEASEIVRLVRAVGDFPNLVYLLCYDRDVLANGLRKAIKVKDGKAYLQKIVQIHFSVPRPEEFDLRRWLIKECTDLYTAITNSQPDEDLSERLGMVCDVQGGSLQTPRDVCHVINALRLFYPPVADQVDYADLCWIQIIRLKNEPLYKWIEEYLTILAAVLDGASVDDAERRKLASRLLELLPEDSVASLRSVWRYQDYIPGIEAKGNNKMEECVLQEIPQSVISGLEARRRLGSPQHYRFYFAFAKPSGALDDIVVKDILKQAEDGQAVDSQFQNLVAVKRPQGGSMYEVLLNRLQRFEFDKLSPDVAEKIVSALGNTVDDAQRVERGGGFFGQKMVWKRARAVFEAVLQRIPTDRRQSFLSNIFQNSSSIGWLLGELIGSELFKHGRVGDMRKLRNPPMLEPEELDDAIATVFVRLNGLDRHRIANVPESLSFFYRWKQAGGEADLKKWMEEQIVTDEGFIALLNKCRGWAASDKVYHPLNKRDLANFMHYDEVIERLNRIATDQKSPPELRAKVEELKNAIREHEI